MAVGTHIHFYVFTGINTVSVKKAAQHKFTLKPKSKVTIGPIGFLKDSDWENTYMMH